ncbi:cytochrome P450 [Halorubellus litoreus]|uniref:Cytochrome P450 n=1 Tax=Halorubellus litoreus TaxID=755308 RepID=A0ABD5VLB4_9EURY
MASTPPGPRGEPLFGDARRYANDPFAFVTALEESYRGIAAFDMGPMETYMVTDPMAIERVLVSEADRFRKPDFQDDALGDLLGDGLLLSEGETWREQRQLASPAFAFDRLSGMAGRITEHADDMVADWSDGDRVDVEAEMTRVTLDVILDLMMGVRVDDATVETIREQMVPLGRRFEPDPLRFAMPSWVPAPDDAEYERAVATLDGVLDDVLAARKGTEGTDEDGPMDFLSVLRRAQDRGEQSSEQLRDELMTMLLAGHDTTALTLTYTMYLLSEHPEAAERVRTEVDDVVGDDDPGMAHVREFEFVEWAIQEAMRLYPPVFTMFRAPTERVELCGYEVPEDVAIMLPQYAVHRSARYWESPDAFDPERFSAARSEDRPRFAYFPFGGGPRHCIGKHLAMLEAQLILARVVQDYELAYDGDGLELLPSLTAHPKDGMPMRVVER